VVEAVDTSDLKSLGVSRAGSSPAPGIDEAMEDPAARLVLKIATHPPGVEFLALRHDFSR
jgi:hypothetical protein